MTHQLAVHTFRQLATRQIRSSQIVEALAGTYKFGFGACKFNKYRQKVISLMSSQSSQIIVNKKELKSVLLLLYIYIDAVVCLCN